MDFQKAKKIMKQFAKEHMAEDVKQHGIKADIQSLVEWMMDDMTRAQEKVLYAIFNKEWNKTYEKQYKLTDSQPFVNAASEYNL